MSSVASRPLFRPFAILLGLLLAFAGLVVPTSAAAAVGDDTSSALSWGFKQSWRSYISNVPPAGTITPSSGAAASGDSYAYTWSASAAVFDPTTGVGNVAFDGDVQFSKPGHGIDITVSNPRVVLTGDGTGDLYWTVGGTEVLGADIAAISVSSATVAGIASTVTVGGSGVTFTAAGGAPFSYPAGDPMDAFTFTISSEVPPPAAPTSTTLTSSSPSVAAGGTVLLSASVTAGVAGTVEFFDGSTSLGVVTVVSNAASTSTTVAASSHIYSAVFTPTASADYAVSTSAGVAVTTVSGNTTLSGNVSGAELSWGFSDYAQVGSSNPASVTAPTAAGWPMVAVSGGAERISPSGSNTSLGFRLTGGTGSADPVTGVGSISYPGSVTYAPYNYGFSSGDFTLSGFVLTTTSTTAGSLTGFVTWRPSAGGQAVGPIPVTLANFGIQSLTGTAGVFSLTTEAPAYAGTVAAGTYSPGYSAAWPTSFVNAVPASFRAFFYQSGTSQGNLNKPAKPITASFTATAPTTTTLASSSPAVATGGSVQLSATVTAGVAGSVEFFDGATSLGSVAASSNSAGLLVTGVTPGAHSYTARFTPTLSTQYGVSTSAAVAVTVAAAPAALSGNVSGAELSWGFSDYAQVGSSNPASVTAPTAAGWPIVAVSGGAERIGPSGSNTSLGFRLTGGTGSADPVTGVGSISYPGSVTYAPYNYGFSSGDFTLSGFVLTTTSTTAGALTGYVTWRPSAGGQQVGPIPVTLATFGIQSLTGSAGDFTLTTEAPAYAGTVAAGTYSPGYSAAWPTSFVNAVPASFRAFFYQSGTSQGNLNKPAKPITASFTATAVTTAVGISVSQTTGLQSGDTVNLSATVSPSTAVGTVRILLDGVQIAEGPASTTLAVSTAALAAGSHTVRAQFVPSNPVAYATSSSPEIVLSVAAPPVPVAGSLSWGISPNFNAYVTGPIASGSISTSNGAAFSGGAYTFVQTTGGTYDRASGVGTAAYRGAVRFFGHNGALDQTLSNPVVRLDSATSGVILATYAGSQITIADLNLADGTRTVATDGSVRYAGVPATLATGGVAFFGGNYAAGSALAPATFVIGSPSTVIPATATTGAPSATTNTAADTPPATTGVESEQREFTEGGAATFTASGFQPNETGILAVIYSEPIVLADDIVADASGAVTWTGFLPLGLTGEHTFTFQGSVDRGIVIDIAPAEVVGCAVESAELDWGFKESFRAYIDGSIANGEWTTAHGATYETPLFSWAGAGGYDSATADADLTFTGSVRFTGHGGVLDTTIANPRVLIDGRGDGDRAVLLLDVTGTTQDGQPVSSLGVEFVELDLAAAELGGGGDLVSFAGIPTTLTEAGAAAFGTYDAGATFDPIDLRITLDPACIEPVAAVDEPTAEGETASATSPLPWVLLAVLVALAVAAAVIVLTRRARRV